MQRNWEPSILSLTSQNWPSGAWREETDNFNRPPSLILIDVSASFAERGGDRVSRALRATGRRTRPTRSWPDSRGPRAAAMGQPKRGLESFRSRRTPRQYKGKGS